MTSTTLPQTPALLQRYYQSHGITAPWLVAFAVLFVVLGVALGWFARLALREGR